MSEYKRKPIIIDGDPGHDDAIALVLAACYKEYFDIKAITSCAGNQTLAKTTLNYQKIATLLNLDVPIGVGRDRPIMNKLEVAPKFHGETGLDGPTLPEPKNVVSQLSAPELMAKVLKESDQKVIIIATGPQTNVAALLLMHPELKEKIELISIMGGGLEHGNWNVAAEFNIFVDPEAADIEFRSGVPILMCGLDVTERALIKPSEWSKIREYKNPVAQTVCGWLDFFYKHLEELGFEGATLHDPCAVMALVHPEIFNMIDVYVEIECDGMYTRGATVPDYHNLKGQKPNCKAVMNLDRDAFVKELIRACASFEKENV